MHVFGKGRSTKLLPGRASRQLGWNWPTRVARAA